MVFLHFSLCKCLTVFFFSFPFTELYKMVCSESGVYTDIDIPSVLLPKTAGESLRAALASGSTGLYPRALFLIL